ICLSRRSEISADSRIRRPDNPRSPNLASIGRRPDHCGSRGAAKRGRKLGHIGKRSVHTELAERVRIGFCLTPRRLWGLIAAPYLGPAQKETLIWCEPVNILLLFSSDRLVERKIGYLQSSKVGNRLSQNGLAILEQSIFNLETRELMFNTIRSCGV